MNDTGASDENISPLLGSHVLSGNGSLQSTYDLDAETNNANLCYLCKGSLPKDYQTNVDMISTVVSKVTVRQKIEEETGCNLPAVNNLPIRICTDCYRVINEMDYCEHKLDTFRSMLRASIINNTDPAYRNPQVNGLRITSFSEALSSENSLVQSVSSHSDGGHKLKNNSIQALYESCVQSNALYAKLYMMSNANLSSSDATQTNSVKDAFHCDSPVQLSPIPLTSKAQTIVANQTASSGALTTNTRTQSTSANDIIKVPNIELRTVGKNSFKHALPECTSSAYYTSENKRDIDLSLSLEKLVPYNLSSPEKNKPVRTTLEENSSKNTESVANKHSKSRRQSQTFYSPVRSPQQNPKEPHDLMSKKVIPWPNVSCSSDAFLQFHSKRDQYHLSFNQLPEDDNLEPSLTHSLLPTTATSISIPLISPPAYPGISSHLIGILPILSPQDDLIHGTVAKLPISTLISNCVPENLNCRKETCIDEDLERSCHVSNETEKDTDQCSEINICDPTDMPDKDDQNPEYNEKSSADAELLHTSTVKNCIGDVNKTSNCATLDQETSVVYTAALRTITSSIVSSSHSNGFIVERGEQLEISSSLDESSRSRLNNARNITCQQEKQFDNICETNGEGDRNDKLKSNFSVPCEPVSYVNLTSTNENNDKKSSEKAPKLIDIYNKSENDLESLNVRVGTLSSSAANNHEAHEFCSSPEKICAFEKLAVSISPLPCFSSSSDTISCLVNDSVSYGSSSLPHPIEKKVTNQTQSEAVNLEVITSCMEDNAHENNVTGLNCKSKASYLDKNEFDVCYRSCEIFSRRPITRSFLKQSIRQKQLAEDKSNCSTSKTIFLDVGEEKEDHPLTSCNISSSAQDLQATTSSSDRNTSYKRRRSCVLTENSPKGIRDCSTSFSKFSSTPTRSSEMSSVTINNVTVTKITHLSKPERSCKYKVNDENNFEKLNNLSTNQHSKSHQVVPFCLKQAVENEISCNVLACALGSDSTSNSLPLSDTNKMPSNRDMIASLASNQQMPSCHPSAEAKHNFAVKQINFSCSPVSCSGVKPLVKFENGSRAVVDSNLSKMKVDFQFESHIKDKDLNIVFHPENTSDSNSCDVCISTSRSVSRQYPSPGCLSYQNSTHTYINNCQPKAHSVASNSDTTSVISKNVSTLSNTKSVQNAGMVKKICSCLSSTSCKCCESNMRAPFADMSLSSSHIPPTSRHRVRNLQQDAPIYVKPPLPIYEQNANDQGATHADSQVRSFSSNPCQVLPTDSQNFPVGYVDSNNYFCYPTAANIKQQSFRLNQQESIPKVIHEYDPRNLIDGQTNLDYQSPHSKAHSQARLNSAAPTSNNYNAMRSKIQPEHKMNYSRNQAIGSISHDNAAIQGHSSVPQEIQSCNPKYVHTVGSYNTHGPNNPLPVSVMDYCSQSHQNPNTVNCADSSAGNLNRNNNIHDPSKEMASCNLKNMTTSSFPPQAFHGASNGLPSLGTVPSHNQGSAHVGGLFSDPTAQTHRQTAMCHSRIRSLNSSSEFVLPGNCLNNSGHTNHAMQMASSQSYVGLPQQMLNDSGVIPVSNQTFHSQIFYNDSLGHPQNVPVNHHYQSLSENGYHTLPYSDVHCMSTGQNHYNEYSRSKYLGHVMPDYGQQNCDMQQQQLSYSNFFQSNTYLPNDIISVPGNNKHFYNPADSSTKRLASYDEVGSLNMVNEHYVQSYSDNDPRNRQELLTASERLSCNDANRIVPSADSVQKQFESANTRTLESHSVHVTENASDLGVCDKIDDVSAIHFVSKENSAFMHGVPNHNKSSENTFQPNSVVDSSVKCNQFSTKCLSEMSISNSNENINYSCNMRPPLQVPNKVEMTTQPPTPASLICLSDEAISSVSYCNEEFTPDVSVGSCSRPLVANNDATQMPSTEYSVASEQQINITAPNSIVSNTKGGCEYDIDIEETDCPDDDRPESKFEQQVSVELGPKECDSEMVKGIAHGALSGDEDAEVDECESIVSSTRSRSNSSVGDSIPVSPQASVAQRYDCLSPELRNVQEATEYHKPTLLVKNIKRKKHAKLQICRQCDQVFSTRHCLERHIERRHKISPVTFQCPSCPKKCNSEQILAKHVIQHKVHTCKLCDETFLKGVSFKKHMEEHSRSLICNICKKECTSIQALVTHSNSHKKEKPRNICEICNKEFTCARNLRIHSLTHSGEKPYSCSNCSKAFGVRSNMLAHQELCTGNCKFKCNICSRSFPLASLLKRHEAVHSGSYPHICQHCSKGFSKLSNFLAHLKIHDSSRSQKKNKNKKDKKGPSGDSKTYNRSPVTCPVCRKVLARAEQLQDHLGRHANNRQYQCPKCPRMFYYKNSIKPHVKAVHFKEKPFVCPRCDKHFASKNGLRVHELHHSGVKPHQCYSCGKAFATKSNYQRHLKCHVTTAVVA